MPFSERTSLSEWPGLLPTETVAITFTRKAAAELKARIRRQIASLRAQSESKEDEFGTHDPRLRNQGDVSMLLSLVDDAPISTIDSFLSSIVSPWMGLVCEDVASEQVDEDGAIFLRDEAIRTAWRLQEESMDLRLVCRETSKHSSNQGTDCRSYWVDKSPLLK